MCSCFLQIWEALASIPTNAASIPHFLLSFRELMPLSWTVSHHPQRSPKPSHFPSIVSVHFSDCLTFTGPSPGSLACPSAGCQLLLSPSGQFFNLLPNIALFSPRTTIPCSCSFLCWPSLPLYQSVPHGMVWRPRSVMTSSLRPQAPLSMRFFSGMNTGVGCCFLLQGIFPTRD